ncbi:Arc family DNA-binding protein [Pseudomonas fragi]|uniref:Arc family DNA-binding protein n=1 Tax=Pseudomonas fragi TaxID=296 RepID=A0A9Q6YEF3_PSEFR|nr:Arc family DNA-binding protein [Pseudomonas fragi]QPL31947.1 Arc family DNA-binding protein [Pseudomonas fragi]
MRNSREQDKFVLRMPDGLRPEISDAASINDRSMNSEIIFRLNRTIELEKQLADKDKIIRNLLNLIEKLEAA